MDFAGDEDGGERGRRREGALCVKRRRIFHDEVIAEDRQSIKEGEGQASVQETGYGHVRGGREVEKSNRICPCM